MNLLIYSPGQDTGGQGVRLKALLERHVPGLSVRSAINKTTYLDYPTDIVISHPRQARDLFRWADIVHLRHTLKPWRQYGGPRPALLHHHGAQFIRDHARIYREAAAAGIPQVVSGMEMQELEPGAAWLPQPHDLMALAAYRPRRRANGPLRIVQCPTRQSKGQEAVRAVVARLAERHDIELDVVEGVSWEESLRRKARADIFIDQIGPLAYGYGNNSVEAWAMGIPVVSEAPGEGVKDRMLGAWGELPFADAGEGLEVMLERLITSRSLREEYAERGLAHARKYHDYPAVAAQLMAYYVPTTIQPIQDAPQPVEARRRLFIVATGQDTCGWGIRIQQGFRRNAPDWTVRSAAATQRYQEYPVDLPFKRPLVRQFYQAADVIQLRNTMHGYHYFDDGAGKPTVLLYHGTAYRKGHVELGAEARRIGAVQIVSTFDLSLFEGDTTWIGSPYNGADLQELRQKHYRADGMIRIAHAPTDRKIKGTDHFLAVVDRLSKRYPIDLVLIENRTWAECLRQKATADIFYDQLGLGYGNNAIEAWGMGIPVIAGVADPAVRQAMRRHWGRLPFPQTTPQTLERRLEALIASEQSRREWAEAGSEHFARWHDERVVVPQLVEIYNAAKPTQPATVRKAIVVPRVVNEQGRERYAGALAARERSRAYQATLEAARVT